MKFDKPKNAFVNETRELLIKEMKDEKTMKSYEIETNVIKLMKKLLAEEFGKTKTGTSKEMEELKSTSAMLQKHVKNRKRSNEEFQKNAKNMNNTVDVYV